MTRHMDDNLKAFLREFLIHDEETEGRWTGVLLVAKYRAAEYIMRQAIDHFVPPLSFNTAHLRLKGPNGSVLHLSTGERLLGYNIQQLGVVGNVFDDYVRSTLPQVRQNQYGDKPVETVYFDL